MVCCRPNGQSRSGRRHQRDRRWRGLTWGMTANPLTSVVWLDVVAVQVVQHQDIGLGRSDRRALDIDHRLSVRRGGETGPGRQSPCRSLVQPLPQHLVQLARSTHRFPGREVAPDDTHRLAQDPPGAALACQEVAGPRTGYSRSECERLWVRLPEPDGVGRTYIDHELPGYFAAAEAAACSVGASANRLGRSLVFTAVPAATSLSSALLTAPDDFPPSALAITTGPNSSPG